MVIRGEKRGGGGGVVGSLEINPWLQHMVVYGCEMKWVDEEI